jgi:hypothetical protein
MTRVCSTWLRQDGRFGISGNYCLESLECLSKHCVVSPTGPWQTALSNGAESG